MDEMRRVIRLLVRTREDYQDMRKRVDARIGRKADKTAQNIPERAFSETNLIDFVEESDVARLREKEIEKKLKKALKHFPIYNKFLANIKGVGGVSAGWITGEFDIHEATTVSKMWQYMGINPNPIRGKRRVKKSAYKENMGRIVAVFPPYKKGESEEYLVETDTMIRGDKLTKGFVSPFNTRLRVALLGVMADGFIKQKNTYALDYYYPYKLRLENEQSLITGTDTKWCDTSKGHRHRAAIRYMIKMFIKDLYVTWREIEGLPVRIPYQEEYLGHRHAS